MGDCKGRGLQFDLSAKKRKFRRQSTFLCTFRTTWNQRLTMLVGRGGAEILVLLNHSNIKLWGAFGLIL